MWPMSKAQRCPISVTGTRGELECNLVNIWRVSARDPCGKMEGGHPIPIKDRYTNLAQSMYEEG